MVSSIQIYVMIVQLGTATLPVLVGSDYHCYSRDIHPISSVAGSFSPFQGNMMCRTIFTGQVYIGRRRGGLLVFMNTLV